MYYIYLLYDPESLNVRYVGVTNNPIRRKYKHRALPDRNAKTHRDNWIRSVINRGLRPEFRVVEEVEYDWQEAECRWIRETKEAGFDLVNSTSGGDGVRDYKPSSAQLLKLQTQNIGKIRSQEFKDKLSETNKGKIPWAAINKSAQGRKISDEGKKKLSESVRNRPRVSCVICKREMRLDKIMQHYGFKH